MDLDKALQLAQREFGDNIASQLKKRVAFFNIVKNLKFENNLFLHKNENKIILPTGTLIHGTTANLEVLSSIKQNGILSSEFVTGRKDIYNETYFMADFFKVPTVQPLSIQTLLTCFDRNQVINYLPNIVADNGAERVAFIVNTENKIAKKYLEKDIFDGKTNADILGFIDEEFYFSLERRKLLPQYNLTLGQSSILVGVPYSMLNGLIVDKNIQETNPKLLCKITEMFKDDLFIMDTSGEILSSPALTKKSPVNENGGMER